MLKLSACAVTASLAVYQSWIPMANDTHTFEGIDARIFEVDEAMRRLDPARIHDAFELADLRRKTIQLKRARNDLTPLCRLPDELLGRIGVYCAMEDYPSIVPIGIFRILSVLSRLRHVLFHTPEIWSHIRLDCAAYLKAGFPIRAAAHPLHIYSSIWPPHHWDFLKRFLAHVDCLDIDAHLRIVDVLTKGYELTESMNQEMHYIRPYLMDPHTSEKRWNKMMLSNRSLMIVRGMTSTVESLPLMPLLRCLRISHLRCRFLDLHRFLSQSPQIESIYLDVAVRDVEVDLVPFARLTLPALRVLQICDTLSCVLALARILPDPSTHLRISVDPGDEDGSSPSIGALSEILSRMDRFWTSLMRTSTTLPLSVESRCRSPFPPRIDESVFLVLRVGHTHDQAGPEPSALFYSRCTITSSDPLLSRISTVRLECDAITTVHQTINPMRLDLAYLPNVNRLLIVGAVFGAAESNENTDVVQRCIYVLDHDGGGQTLHSVELHACVDHAGIVDRLKQLGASEKILWYD
jgi:hypothetical protein